MRRLTTAILAVIMTFSALTGCGSAPSPGTVQNTETVQNTQSQEASKIYRAAIDTDWEHCDPQMTTVDYTVPLNIFDRLVEVKSDKDSSAIVPGLATDWTVSDDGLVYNFKLRQGVKFHNGEIFKADDVKYTFERMLLPENNTRNSDALTPIKGADAMLNGEVTALDGLKIISDYEIEITLEDAYAPFLANIATPAGSVFNRKATEAAGLEFGVNPDKTCGTGPYYLAEWAANDHTLILAFNDYWGGSPKNDGVRFQVVPDEESLRMMFENDELDEVDLDMARSHIPYFKSSDKWKNQVIMGDRVGIYYYSMNENIKPFDDVRVRKAFQMSIDRQGILDSPLFSGLGSVHSGIMPPGLIGYNPDLPEIKYDPDKAKQLLAEAGYPDGFEMVINQVSGNSTTLSLNELVVSMLAKVGIKATIEQLDEASYYAIRGEGELSTYTTSWSADFNDPDNFFYSMWAPANSVNRSWNYYNTDAMNRIVAARYMTDQTARIAEYRALEKLVIQDDAVWAPLFSLKHLWVVQPRVQNFKPLWNGWSGTFYNDITLAG